MSRLAWSESALSGLDILVLSHSLPADTRDRIEASARPLKRFPRLGPKLRRYPDGGEVRFLIGPWPWLVIVYLYLETDDLAIIVSIEDGRAAISTTGSERARQVTPARRSPQTSTEVGCAGGAPTIRRRR